MNERKYSVKEIREMRRAIYQLEAPRPPDGVDCEAMLQTYMVNGTDPEELKTAAAEVYAARMARRQSA